MGPVAQYLHDKLTEAFAPEQLSVINESHLHAGHHGHDGEGETHLRIKIVSNAFEDMSRVNRHRAINEVVQPKIDEGLHACAIEVSTP
jgi:BolA protein